MPMRTVTMTLLSSTELLMDRDNISFAELLTRWQKDPANADQQVPGDDRAPAWGWLGKLHYDEASMLVGIPMGMLTACLRGAATTIPHPTASGRKTLKEASQAGLQFTQTLFPLLVPGEDGLGWRPIRYDTLFQRLASESDFLVHEAVCRAAGFRLDVRRSKPQYNRAHIRVRPMFGPWRCVCEVRVLDEVLTDPVLLQMFQIAGSSKGMGNWRPSNGKAGSYGIFSTEVGLPAELRESVKGLAA
jgi:hypothetical protein